MKLFLRILCTAILGCFSLLSSAQCPTGYTATAINWDAMAFLVQEGTYVSQTIAQNQKFAFGKNQMTITHNYAAANTVGDNSDHTGSASSFGDGADVQFNGNGSISLDFGTAVQNVKFSLYDIDVNQRIAITAYNGGVAQAITTLAKVGGTLLTIAGSGTNTATVTAGSSHIDNSSTDGTINVTINGPVTKITLTITLSGTASEKIKGKDTVVEPGSFYLSDISACSITDPFPSGYRAVAQPLPGQPGYVLVARNNIVYMTDPATGRSAEVFRDPSNLNINSMGYDPHNKILYFTNSLTLNGGANPNNKSIKKYDFESGTLSVLVSDVTASLSIPTFGSGVESGGASFYDGALYLGIEGTNSSSSTIWRIDFDASLNPISARQAFGIALAGHDWGDFVIANGTLYDFDGAASSNENVFHVDLQTGAYSASYPASFGIRQVAVDWTDKIFNIGGAPSSTGEVIPYNNDGTINNSQFKAISVNGVTPSGSWGDAAEAFRPKVDFGDAPASYDLNNSTLTFHDIDPNLKLGPTIKTEWNQLSTSNTDDDDDGMTFVPILNQGGGVYQTDVRVFNNTGTNATLGGWMDFNGDGKFDSNEGVTVNVSSNASEQVVSLYWTGISYNLPNNSYTYLRLRLTSAANAMTTANATGYMADGEIEDWYVLVNATTLAVNLKQFSADKWENSKSKLTWKVEGESNNTVYELQRSNNGLNWTTIYTQKASSSAAYSFIDHAPFMPGTYYRLRYYEVDGSEKYSTVQQVLYQDRTSFKVFPNPAYGQVTLAMEMDKDELAVLNIMDVGGKNAVTKMLQLVKGTNRIVLPIQQLTPGAYYIQVQTSNNRYSQKVLVQNK